MDAENNGRAHRDALVTDTHERGALAGLRGLGRAGLTVVAVAPSRRAPGLVSRYAVAAAVAPDPALDAGGFAEAVANVARREDVGVIYPGSEEAIDALRGTPLEPRLPYARLGALDRLRDKRTLPGLAAEAGLTCPETLAAGLPGEISAAALDGPTVVKSALGVGPLPFTTPVADATALRALLARLPRDQPVLVQRRYEGVLVGVALVVDAGGRVAARFQQRATRTWPLAAGVSASAVSMAPDDRLIDGAAALLSAAGYAGLAHLQFIVRDGREVLIDVNPRFYGSMPLALAAGVNLPAVWHAVVTGAEPPEVGRPRVGVRFRWLEGNLLAAMRGKPRALLDAPLRRRTSAVWARDDPRAGVAFGLAAVEQRIRRRLARR